MTQPSTPPPALPPLPAPPRTPQTEASVVQQLPGGEDFTPDEAITIQLASLERWTTANQVRERRRLVRFWGLQTLALGAAVGAAAAGHLAGHPAVALSLIGVAALAIVVEAMWTASDSHGSSQHRALYALRELQNTIVLKWDAARLAFPQPAHPRRVAHALALLETISAKREEIGKYLDGAHASPTAVLTRGEATS